MGDLRTAGRLVLLLTSTQPSPAVTSFLDPSLTRVSAHRRAATDEMTGLIR